MIAFVPVATHALYVPFDSAFVYLGYLPDFYFMPEPGEDSIKNCNSFSIGRLCFPFHRSFGVGVRKPRFVGDSHYRTVKYMGKDYFLTEVKCLNMKNSVYCGFSSRLPVRHSEMEKVMVLEKLCKQKDHQSLEDLLLNKFSFSDFFTALAAGCWGRYLCITYKDQEAILSFISNSPNSQEMDFSMMPVGSFYGSSIEPRFTDSCKDSLWSGRLKLSSYVYLGNIYRSLILLTDLKVGGDSVD